MFKLNIYMAFLDLPIKNESYDGHNITLLQPLTYITNAGETITVPISASSDGASTPQAIWNVIPPFGKYWPAAILHDYLYRITKRSKSECDHLLLEAMESLGVGIIERTTIFEGVNLAGKSSFDKDRKYGWRPQVPDHRDFKLSLPPSTVSLPVSADLREGMPEIWNQLSLGSCTSNALAAAYAFELKRQGLAVFTPSRLFIYYNEREMENTVESDAGAMLRDGIKSLSQEGVCDEVLWPYDITKFTLKPTPSVYDSAHKSLVLAYYAVNQELNSLKQCLASGLPFVCGISVYQSFESDEVARTGIVPLPGISESNLGGHAVAICGFSDVTQTFLVRNSWGSDWGQEGYFTIPYSYLTNSDLASDFWAISTISS